MKDIISPVNTEDDLFHDGDPSTGIEGTAVSAKWLNPVQGAIIGNQQELASVLKEAGIKIDPSKQDQLLAAIKKITGTATEGYVKRSEFGIGGNTPIISSSGTLDIMKSSQTGKYAVSQGSTDMPSTTVSYELDWSSINFGRDGVLIARALIEKGSVYNKTYRNSLRNGIWQGWIMLYDEANKPLASDLDVYTKSEANNDAQSRANNAQKNAIDWANSNCVRGVRFGALETTVIQTNPGGYRDQVGYVITQVSNEDNDPIPDVAGRRTLQILIGSSWRVIGS